jgi:transposase
VENATSVLLDLPGFRVVEARRVERESGPEARLVVVETVEPVAACPECGVLASRVHERPAVRVKDLPVGSGRLRLVWRKRRYRCQEPLCARRSFTETSPAVPGRARLTGRLREQLAAAVGTSNRAVSDVAREYGVAWWTVQRAVVTELARRLPAPQPTTMIGIDETRARSVRWLVEDAPDGRVWRRSDPWMTSIVDLDPTHPRGILGLAPGRSGACVEAWLALQTSAFRDGITTVAIDPSAPYASGIRRSLPAARIVVDHWHLVRLANQMVTDVRQRAQREQHDRRGRKADPAWAHRRLLLRAGNALSPRALARLRRVLASDDPTNEIGAAWGCKELLRQLLATTRPAYSRHLVAHRLHRFLAACADANMPETTRLATTVEAWWTEIEGFLELGVTNARTEGYNRVIKQVKRVGCGFRNQTHYEQRIMLHIAVTQAA